MAGDKDAFEAVWREVLEPEIERRGALARLGGQWLDDWVGFALMAFLERDRALGLKVESQAHLRGKVRFLLKDFLRARGRWDGRRRALEPEGLLAEVESPGEIIDRHRRAQRFRESLPDLVARLSPAERIAFLGQHGPQLRWLVQAQHVDEIAARTGRPTDAVEVLLSRADPEDPYSTLSLLFDEAAVRADPRRCLDTQGKYRRRALARLRRLQRAA